MVNLFLIVNAVPLIVWIYLWLGRGGFWQTENRLPCETPLLDKDYGWPTVSIVIPARNEAHNLPITLPVILDQDYPGSYHVFLIDDHSDDNTGVVATAVASEIKQTKRLSVIEAEPLPPGWTGKLWALEQGTKASMDVDPEFFLFTDADILHARDSLQLLVTKAVSDQLDLVSLMVKLRINTLWERLLIPAFVYFFTMIYPFSWVNSARRKTAAAAGGCILLRRVSLCSVGGLVSIRDRLIDDCAMAKAIKHHGGLSGGKIWLGLTEDVNSIRGYDDLREIWGMVTRTAYTQLNYSPLLLLGTISGLVLVFLVPPLGFVCGFVGIELGWTPVVAGWISVMGFTSWLLMIRTYWPMLKLYKVSPFFALLLPIIATFYAFMTLHSAWQYLFTIGNTWKGRSYRKNIEM